MRMKKWRRNKTTKCENDMSKQKFVNLWICEFVLREDW
jgi:hypothetical protein